MIQYVKDKDLIWDIDNYDVALIGTSTYCLLGNGLQRKIRKKFPIVNEANIELSYGDPKRLGTRLNVVVNSKIKPLIISLCFITGYPNARPDLQPDYLNYEALEQCIKTANVEFEGKNVVTTIIGSSRFDGNGDRERIIEILEKNSDKLNLTIYDYFQMSRSEENKKQWEEIQVFKTTDYKKFRELSLERKRNWKKLYL